jgi:hypothetical protein
MKRGPQINARRRTRAGWCDPGCAVSAGSGASARSRQRTDRAAASGCGPHDCEGNAFCLLHWVTVFLPPPVVLAAPTTTEDRTIAAIDSAYSRGPRGESFDDQLSSAPLLIMLEAAATATGRNAASLDQAGSLWRLDVGQPVLPPARLAVSADAVCAVLAAERNAGVALEFARHGGGPTLSIAKCTRRTGDAGAREYPPRR